MSDTGVMRRTGSARSRSRIRRALLVVSVLYLLNAVAGTWLAVRDQLSGRPFGWQTGLAPLSGFIYGPGTALSAPLALLLLLIVLTLLMVRRGSGWVAGFMVLLGIGFLVGMLAEPITWEVLNPPLLDPIPAAVVIANIVLPLAIVILALGTWRHLE